MADLDPRDVQLADAWHLFQHAYYDAPRTRSGGRIIGGVTCRPQLDAMADILAQAHVHPAHPWPLARVHLQHACCGTQAHG